MTIDARLLSLYNEYLENNKESEFIDMLYAILDIATKEVREKVYRKRAYQKRKATQEANKANLEKFRRYYDNMDAEERIKFLNTPYDQHPDWIKAAFPKLVQYPEQNNFVRILGLVNEEERQREITGARIIRYMEAHGFITADEEGTKLHYDRFAQVCNELAERYDLEWRPGHKAQRTRITQRDLKNYTCFKVTPKKDKMAILATAMNVPIWYIAGYLNNNPNINDGNPLSIATSAVGKFRKNTKRKAA